MKNLILILGVPGVGKTETCKELKTLLSKNILIEADYLLDTTPFIYNQETKDIYYKNIVYLINNFITHSEIENIIHSWIVPKKEVLQSILSQLNMENVILHLFALTCSEEEHIRRINKDTNPRRKATGLGNSVENLKNYNNVNHKKIDTTELTAKEVAELIAKEMQK